MIYLTFVFAVLTRAFSEPHVPLFTPVFGALLFAGARLKRRDAVWFPVMVLAVCDWILTTCVFHMKMQWGHSVTLVGFAAMAGIGGFLRHSFTVARFTGCAIAAPTAYFLISNFGVWFCWSLYPHTWTGLIACYVAGLPYYRNSLFSTFVIGAVLFGGHELLSRRLHGKHFEPEPAPAN